MLFAAFAAVGTFGTAGCRDISRFDSGADHYEGTVVSAAFVRTGIAASTRLCLTLDTEHLDDAPGEVWSSDGTFAKTALAPIPPLAHDPLSTLSFGDGRAKNLMFAARKQADAGASEVFLIVSLMDSGDVEVRLLTPGSSQPALLVDAGLGSPAPFTGIFAVFPLERKPGVCPFGPS